MTLVSRIFSPADFDPTSEDRRRRGLAVRHLEIDGRVTDIAAAGCEPGWHAAEPAWCWTDGAATLNGPGAREIPVVIAMIGLRHEPAMPQIAAGVSAAAGG